MATTAIEETASPAGGSPRDGEPSARLGELRQLIEQAGELLPLSGPVSAFAFLNTLQAFEDLPFEEGLRKGAQLYGAEPFLPKNRYRQYLSRRRIRREDLIAVLRDDLGERADERIDSLSTRLQIRLAMLEHPLRLGPSGELQWFVAETDALTRMRDDVPLPLRERFVQHTRRWVMRDLRVGKTAPPNTTADFPIHHPGHTLTDLIEQLSPAMIEQWDARTWEKFALQALWRICRDGVADFAPRIELSPESIRHRGVLLHATGEDSDRLVQEVLIRFCAAFLDQGFSHWPLPHREEGFYRSFLEVYSQPGGPPNRWRHGLAEELTRLLRNQVGPLESIQESLELLGVRAEEWSDFLTMTTLALRGWAGMIWQAEVRGDRVPSPVPSGSLVEFVAVHLILERFALDHVARQTLGDDGPLDRLRDRLRSYTAEQEFGAIQRAFSIFQLAQVLGWSPDDLDHLTSNDWSALIQELEDFPNVERRRMFHRAFERRFRIKALDAISVHSTRPTNRIANPRFQAAFCVDARAESFRRHLEELVPDVETFGLAGFFGVAMYYRGVADAHFTPQCPIVVRPQHWVVEDVVYPLEEVHQRRAKTRKALGAASHQLHVGSRGFVGAAILSTGLGVLASVPLMARVLLPRLTARIRRTARRLVEPPPITRLRLERQLPTPGPEGGHLGYSLEEMADIGERMLRDIGLISGFARLVFFLGHGSFCLNNPHKSAYDCGACSGSSGGPNGRALAMILNDLRVRDVLAEHDIAIPSTTWFLGGLHNTGDDSLTFYDLDLLPMSHRRDFEAARATLEETCERNAHERCRRFYSAPLDISYEAAHRHVEARTQDLAQTRPEYGNATNALCIVGRRSRTYGLYLDRRAFLMSYDPTQDDADATILKRILDAVVPVCEGINMQYNLSHVDSPGWACGTKLPHNVTSLLGIMDGAASDLRPGLPWQGVDIHEPMRCLFVIETTPEAMVHIMERNELVGRVLRNGWVQLAVLDPHSNRLQLFQNGRFENYQPESTNLAKAPSSLDWYRGWREHLDFAAIERSD